MDKMVFNIKLAFLCMCLPVLCVAQTTEFDSKRFLPKLVGVKVLSEPMTAPEVLAMDPVCLEIGMGTAVESSWGYPGMTGAEMLAILAQPQYAPWALIGPRATAQWLHHYCWGKVAKSRYFSTRDKNKRNAYNKHWREGMQYSLDESAHLVGKSWPFNPLMHQEIAESYFYEQAYQKAIVSAGKAIALDPSMGRAYTILADSHQKLGNAKKALEVVTDGLKQGNQTKALKRRYKELGGVMPYPEPVAKPAINLDSSHAEKPMVEPATPVTATENKISPESAEKSVAPPEISQHPAKPANNPYCRFCP